jgi:hypothetical protein
MFPRVTRLFFQVNVLLLPLLLGCSSKELTRPRVKDLLAGNTAFTEQVTALPLNYQNQGRHDPGEVEDLWKFDRGVGVYTLTPKGHTYFAQDFRAMTSAPLAKPTKREILEVTGIAGPPQGGENFKVATFTWRYADLPEVVARYTGESVTHEGEAAFQLFDDGWRVQEIHLHEHQKLADFHWPPELEQKLQKQLESQKFTSDQALQLAKPAIDDYEPVLNFSFHPAWNIPVTHGLTGAPLNGESIKTFLGVLKKYGIGAAEAAPSSGYMQAGTLTPPAAWSQFERKPRYNDGKSYAIFEKKDVRVTAFNYEGPDSENASLNVEVSYSQCTPVCTLAKELEALPPFDHGGRVPEKIFYSYPSNGWKEKDTGTVYFQREPGGTWKVSGVR